MATTYVASAFVNVFLRQFSYQIHFYRNIRNLKESLNMLEAARNDVNNYINAAESNIELVSESIRRWFSQAEDIHARIMGIFEQVIRTTEGEYRLFPDLRSRYILSRKAVWLTEDVKDLIMRVPAYDVTDAGDAPSREKLIMKEVMDKLKEDGISIIGLYGMGGVGKTTVAMKVGKRAIAEKAFDVVVWVVVTPEYSDDTIQSQLAEGLGYDILPAVQDGISTTHQRAIILREKISTDSRKILLILDDIWRKMELGDIGIPVVQGGGCKLLLTTRSRSACHEMGAQMIFEIAYVTDEGWGFFKEKVGGRVESAGRDSIAKEFFDECGGNKKDIEQLAVEMRSWIGKINPSPSLIKKHKSANKYRVLLGESA